MSQRVLVFDSDAAFADDVRQNFERMGLEVDVANDGPSGLQMASAHRPSLILLSIELPGMNGFLVCKKIKKIADLEHVPLVIMSSEVDQETFEQHKKLRTRANEYVRKPIQFPQLLNLVSGYVVANGHANGHVNGNASAPPAAVAAVAAVNGQTLNGHVAPASVKPAANSKRPSKSPADVAQDIEEAFSMSDDEVIILPDDDARDTEEAAAASGAMESIPVIEAEVATGVVNGVAALDALSGHPAPEVTSDVTAVRESQPAAARTPTPLPELRPKPSDLVPPPVANGMGTFGLSEPAPSSERESVPSLRSVSQQVHLRSSPPLESAAQAAAHAAEVDRIKRELIAADEKAQAADRRAVFAEQRAVGAEKALDAAKRTGGASSRELLDLREQLNRKDRELLELRTQVASRDKQLLEASDRGLAVERELQDLRDAHSDLQRDLEKKSELVIALSGDKETARKRLDDAKARAERNETKVKELSTALDEIRLAQQLELERLTSVHVQAQQSLRVEHSALLEQRVQQHANDQQASAAKHAAELAALREQHAKSLADHQRAFEDEQNELREEHSVTQKSAADRAEQDKRSALEAQRAELTTAQQERVAETEQRLTAAHAADLTKQTEQHRGELAQLAKQLSDVEASLAKLASESEKAREEGEGRLRAVTEERDQLDARSSGLAAQLSRAQARSERDHELLDRVRKAMAIGLGLLEEQKHEPA